MNTSKKQVPDFSDISHIVKQKASASHSSLSVDYGFSFVKNSMLLSMESTEVPQS